MRDGFISVASGVPNLALADCRRNAEQTFAMMRAAEKAGVHILILPELGLTGYTCGDLFFQDALLQGAEDALATVLEATRPLEVVTAVGLPLRVGGKLYDCAAVIQKGRVLGVVPKSRLSDSGECAEKRWFSPAPRERGCLTVCGQRGVPFGAGQLFACAEIPELILGIEIGADLFAPDAPSVRMANDGATVIGNLSASADFAGRAAFRRRFVSTRSGGLVCGYVCASAGEGESSADLVFGAHQLIAEDGKLLAERRFEGGLLASEIDVCKLDAERRRTGLFPESARRRPPRMFPEMPERRPESMERRADAEDAARAIRPDFPPAMRPYFSLTIRPTALTRYISPSPFVPEEAETLEERCKEILLLSALGLKRRLQASGSKTCVIGLSGGLDSTLALLITVQAMGMLDRPRRDVIAVTMPGFGTTDNTRGNAEKLAEALGVTLRTVPISAAVRQHFRDIGHDPETRNVTYENAQARERTQILMDIANDAGGLVIGTGDLSELALGWCTYNGDHMSMYGVNASTPKTLIRHVIRCAAEAEPDTALSNALLDVLNTPISPELLPAVQGEISQKTEELVGPYELHDFFLYYAIRWGFAPRKVYRLAQEAFGKRYTREALLKWMRVFYRRFFSQQFKRDCLPDGPKVGAVDLSPRGGWRMPSDAAARLWLAEIDALE